MTTLSQTSKGTKAVAVIALLGPFVLTEHSWKCKVHVALVPSSCARSGRWVCMSGVAVAPAHSSCARSGGCLRGGSSTFLVVLQAKWHYFHGHQYSFDQCAHVAALAICQQNLTSLSHLFVCMKSCKIST